MKNKRKKIAEEGKQKGRTSVGMVLLAVFLIWNFLQTISNSLMGQNSLEYKILEYYNIVVISQFVFIPILILNVLGIYAIFSRKKWGYKVLQSFLILTILVTIAMHLLTIANLDLINDFALESGMTNDLPAEKIEFVFDPISLSVIVSVFVIFYLFLIFYVHRKRGYLNR